MTVLGILVTLIRVRTKVKTCTASIHRRYSKGKTNRLTELFSQLGMKKMKTLLITNSLGRLNNLDQLS